ncbi:uncharacterized protein LAJ45_04370 [Morchella importuna]|uniref:Thioredoxin domain-containing protein n=1 Tax=Morchella conica CCBAS932 TaxID=1392247 RepID=A0A3N4KGU9_9PEZI|nr:uncharacterized protein LAJ45_04370 [Morchella importuna]KAH8151748.1 hypothetical protein LAJ45_04370 [Morchella importuna]RPB08589.1 hypothetical protein P167DRAFT_567831 [Morchella conica CCBAS932]
MQPQEIQSYHHYQEITGTIGEGRVIAIYFYDVMAPPCWTIQQAYNDAAANPSYAGRVGFYSFRVGGQDPELDQIQANMRICNVPAFAFVREGEFNTVICSAEEVAGVIADNVCF